MKIKRFFAPDIRQAIRMVREEQGPDAVILSNRSVEGGVEIVSAVDYDEEEIRSAAPVQNRNSEKGDQVPQSVTTSEHPAKNHYRTDPDVKRFARPSYLNLKKSSADSPKPSSAASASPESTRLRKADSRPIRDDLLVQMHEELRSLRHMMLSQFTELAWERLRHRKPTQTALLRRLFAFGLSPNLCHKVVDEIGDDEDLERAWMMSVQSIIRRIPIVEDDLLAHGGIFALVGPTGVGKTTTIAKLAARYALRHGHRHIALVTTDCYRIGAHEQLHNYGRILDVPVRVAANADELHEILNSFSDRRLILIDTAGMSQRDMRLAEQFRTLGRDDLSVRPYLVIAATTQSCSLDQILPVYRGLGLEGCVLTKVDETARLGDSLSVIIEQNLPMAFFGDGQRVPEDLHPARAHTVVDYAVRLYQRNFSEYEFEDDSMAVAFGGLALNAHISVTS